MKLRLLFCLALAWGAGALGCSKGGSLSGTVPVSGTVTYNGQPLEGAQVGFTPVAQDGKPANGVTDAQGNFTVQTYLGGTNQAPGALPGDYVAVIRKETGGSTETGPTIVDPDEARKKMEAANSGEQVAMGPKLATPAKYADATQSPLKITVKAGGEPFKFDLTD